MESKDQSVDEFFSDYISHFLSENIVARYITNELSKYPSFFVDQPFQGKRGEPSLILGWVHEHDDQCFCHISILVENIDHYVNSLKSLNFEFSGQIVSARHTDLRQIFTRPELKENKAFTVLELIDRHNHYQEFLPPHASSKTR